MFLHGHAVKMALELERINILHDLKVEQVKETKHNIELNRSMTQVEKHLKPYDYRVLYEHSVIQANVKREYEFPHKVYQITVMPVPAEIELYLDWEQQPYTIKDGESLNMTSSADLMQISNTANPAITEEVRIYCFGRR